MQEILVVTKLSVHTATLYFSGCEMLHLQDGVQDKYKVFNLTWLSADQSHMTTTWAQVYNSLW